MKKFLTTFFAIILVVPILFCACKSDDNSFIDLSVYFDNNVQCYATDGTKIDVDSENFTADDFDETYRYNQIVFKYIPKWTAGLFVQYIEFDICSNEDAIFDISFKMSNLAQSEDLKYNESYLWYFENNDSLKLKKDQIVHKKILINQNIGDGNGGFSIIVDKDSTLALSKTLQYKITNLKMSAYHKN